MTPSVPDLAPRPFQPLTHLLKAKGTGRGQRRGGTGHRGHARAPPLRTLLLCKGPPRSPLDAGRWAGLVTPPGASWGPAIVTRSSPGWPAGGREPPRGEADAPSRQLGPPAPRAATTDAPRRGSPAPCAGWFRVRPVFSRSCPRGHRPPAEGVGGHAQGHAAEEQQSGVSQAGLTEPGGRALTPPCGGAGTAPCAEPGLPGWKEGGRCPQRADLCDTGCFGVPRDKSIQSAHPPAPNRTAGSWLSRGGDGEGRQAPAAPSPAVLPSLGQAAGLASWGSSPLRGGGHPPPSPQRGQARAPHTPRPLRRSPRRPRQPPTLAPGDSVSIYVPDSRAGERDGQILAANR